MAAVFNAAGYTANGESVVALRNRRAVETLRRLADMPEDQRKYKAHEMWAEVPEEVAMMIYGMCLDYQHQQRVYWAARLNHQSDIIKTHRDWATRLKEMRVAVQVLGQWNPAAVALLNTTRPQFDHRLDGQKDAQIYNAVCAQIKLADMCAKERNRKATQVVRTKYFKKCFKDHTPYPWESHPSNIYAIKPFDLVYSAINHAMKTTEKKRQEQGKGYSWKELGVLGNDN
jgi:hypothetical protein